MRNVVVASILVFLATSFGFAKVAVFWQDGFPTVASQPVARKTLAQALDRTDRFSQISFLQISMDVSFQDQLSGKQFSGRLDPGRAAMLVIAENGTVAASYGWTR